MSFQWYFIPNIIIVHEWFLQKNKIVLKIRDKKIYFTKLLVVGRIVRVHEYLLSSYCVFRKQNNHAFTLKERGY